MSRFIASLLGTGPRPASPDPPVTPPVEDDSGNHFEDASGLAPGSRALPSSCGAVLLQKHSKSDPSKHLKFQAMYPVPQCGPKDAVIRMLFSPINPSDVSVCEGTYLNLPTNLPAVPGLEGCGVIVAVGNEVDCVIPGDLVVKPRCETWGFDLRKSRGAWCEYTVVKASGLKVLPQDLDPRKASMLCINPQTAYGLLHGAQSGDWVVQNAANSGMGIAIIQVAKLRGIRTVNIVRREGLEQSLRALGADAVVVYDGERSEDWQKKLELAFGKVQEVTRKAKIRLALNSVCGLSGELMAKCLGSGGTILTYGAISKEPMSVAGGQLMFKQVTYSGFSIGNWIRENPHEEGPMWDFLVRAAADGSLQFPDIDAEFPLPQVHDAMKRACEPNRNGKVLLRCSEEGPRAGGVSGGYWC